MAVNVKDMKSTLSASMQMRTMGQGDLSDVMVIENEAYSHPWTLGIFRDCVRVGYRCWVCEIDGEMMGYGVVMMASTEAHILNLCIHPSHQSKGYGRELLEFLIDQSQQNSADMVLLEVRESNASAITLYESSGFHELGVRRDYYPADNGREDAIILAKYLEV